MLSFKTDKTKWLDTTNFKREDNIQIGTLTYHYDCNGTKDFHIYTYDPLYHKFMEKIKSVYDELHYGQRKEMKLNEYNEDVVNCEIIYVTELSAIRSTLNKISGHKVHIVNLKSNFFKNIKPDDDIDVYNYEKLLIDPNDNCPTIRNLNVKLLSDYKIIADDQIIECIRGYIYQIRNRKNIKDIILICNDQYDQLKGKHIKTNILELYDNEIKNNRAKFISIIKDINVISHEKREKFVKISFELANIILTIESTEDNNDIIGRTLISMGDEKEKC